MRVPWTCKRATEFGLYVKEREDVCSRDIQWLGVRVYYYGADMSEVRELGEVHSFHDIRSSAAPLCPFRSLNSLFCDGTGGNHEVITSDGYFVAIFITKQSKLYLCRRPSISTAYAWSPADSR